MNDALLVIDEGTSSTRAVLVDADGAFRPVAQRAIETHFPQPGWVEQDAEEIWRLTLEVARQAVAGQAQRVRAIGITNQRETIVAWDRETGRALAPAIVWQDRRTAAACDRLRAAGEEAALQARSGLLLDPYFSATKIRWMLDHVAAVRDAGDRLALGTIDSWLVFKLSGGAHVTDATNASRTALMELCGGWDDGLCDLFGVPRRALPKIVDCAGPIAISDPDMLGRAIPICGMAGDQQAAAIGQSCLTAGTTKATYGTGAFILTHAGETPPVSAHRLLATVAWQVAGERRYALEGSLFVAGRMIQWMRDHLGLIASSDECTRLASSITSSGGVQIVPAFTGLGAPHWQADARAAIFGLTLGTGKAELVRAALEAVANQSAELQRAFAADGVIWSTLRIDGGMAANDWLAQDLANLLGIPVERPQNVECTIKGAAALAAFGCGLYPTLPAAAEAMRGGVQCFEPSLDPADRDDRVASWDRAVAAVVAMGKG
ncbi:MAG: glycerol kinase GlpK [Sphingomicrobium sp.]